MTSATENIFAGLSGRTRIPAEPAPADLPLIVALHGGSYTSAYFDLPGCSLLERAAALRIPIVAVDRPGYESSPALTGEDASIAGQARFLTGALAQAWEGFGGGTKGIVLIGHSIGAAIATHIAAAPGPLPVIGLAISGVGPAHARSIARCVRGLARRRHHGLSRGDEERGDVRPRG